MSVFAKLFGRKFSTASAEFDVVNNDPPLPLAFEKSSVRLVVLEERGSARVPLYDSKAIRRVEETPPTQANQSCKLRCEASRSWPRGVRPCGSSLILPLELPENARAKSLPKPSPTQSAPHFTVSGNVKYQLCKLSPDVKMLGEMAFGALPMKSAGSNLKIHEIRAPHQLMLSEVFTFLPGTANNSKDNTSSLSSDRLSIESDPGPALLPPTHPLSSNSRFYVQLSSHESDPQRLEPEVALSPNQLPSSTSPASTPTIRRGCSSHGNLANSQKRHQDRPSPSIQRSVPVGKSASSTSLGPDGGVEQRMLSKSKPVDVPFLSLRGPDDEEQLIPSSYSSSTSDSYKSPCRHFRSLSPSSSTCSSNVSSALSSSYASVHKRWMRNQVTSLELMGRNNHSDGNAGEKFGSRQNLENKFSKSSISSSGKKPAPSKLALSVIISLDDDASHQTVLAIKTFLFTHAALLEARLRRLRVAVEAAICNKKDFIHALTAALETFRAHLYDLISSPRLPHPAWLRLTSATSNFPSATNKSGGVADRRAVCYSLLWKLSQLVDRLDTKHSNFFFSSLLTAVLTHHLAWVTTVSPSITPPSAKSRQYLQKRVAPWLDELVKTSSYNPLWGQLGDLFGAVAFPLKVTQTVLVGSKKEVVRDLLFVLSYFIRCSDLTAECPASFPTDFWDQALNQLLFQESTVSTRSVDTVVAALPRDFDDKTVESTKTDDIDSSDDDRSDDGLPMCRPRSNTVLERRPQTLGDESRTIDAPVSPTAPDQANRPADLPSRRFEDSGCFETVPINRGAVGVSLLPNVEDVIDRADCDHKREKDALVVDDVSISRKTSELSPSMFRGDANSVDSGSSSKASSTCQSDEGFESIQSGGASKDVSPAPKELLLIPPLTLEEEEPKRRASTLKEESFCEASKRGKIASARDVAPELRNRFASSLTDLDATELPCVRMEDATGGDGCSVNDPFMLDYPWAGNLGYSLLGNFHVAFRPDFALQGTSDRTFIQTLPQHLSQQVENSFLDERILSGSCIVADLDNYTVDLYSSQASDPKTPVPVTPANLVVGMTESLRDLFRVSAANAAPEMCLMQLEDKLQEIYFKSLIFNKILPSLQEWRCRDKRELRNLLGFEMSDVPLLAAVASTHEENLPI